MSSYSAYGVSLTFVSANGGYRVEKSNSTIGYCVPQGSDWRIEYGSSTAGYLKSGRIEVGSGNTTSVSSADPSGAPDHVKATFYVFKQTGHI
jgi:hypothetical protein